MAMIVVMTQCLVVTVIMSVIDNLSLVMVGLF